MLIVCVQLWRSWFWLTTASVSPVTWRESWGSCRRPDTWVTHTWLTATATDSWWAHEGQETWIVHSPVCQKPGGSLVFLSLQVRLLTGIGRYNEMTYVFDLLHQNHRFEMLLRKKVESVSDQCISFKIQK